MRTVVATLVLAALATPAFPERECVATAEDFRCLTAGRLQTDVRCR